MAATMPRPPGAFVEVGGTPMHVVVRGAGAPTVVLESGLGGTVVEWEDVASAVADHATVFSRDRPGLGWSPYARRDRRAVQAARDLHEALRACDLQPPFVVVGHSLGGLHARAFAHLFPADVAGVVLVDPTHEDQWQVASLQRSMAVARGLIRSLVALRAVGGSRILAALYQRQILGALANPPSPSARHAIDTIRALGTTQFQAIRDEYADLTGSCTQVRGLRRDGVFPAVPLTVLTQGHPPRSATARNIVDTVRDTYHADLVGLAPEGRHLIAENSGHLIPIEQPNLIIDAVLHTIHRPRRSLS